MANIRKATLKISLPEIFRPLIDPVRYKGAHGGRGSAKSHFFASSAVERCILYQRTRIVCVREVQLSMKESVKRLVEDKIESMGVRSLFDVRHDRIVTPGDGVVLFQGMTDHTAESIKSLEDFDIAYAEEAQTMSRRSLEYLRPTIRRDPTPDRPGSELWFSWNPRSPADPVDKLFRGLAPPPNAVSVRTSYRDNPFFPKVLEEERAYDEIHNRDRYAHVWLGEYEPTVVGAIWDRQTIEAYRIAEPPEMGRIVVAVDPAVTSGEESNEHGIVVCARGEDSRGYVLQDASRKGTPHQWARQVLAMYDKWDADAIVVEVNQGGDMVKETIRSVRSSVRIVEVRAARGKHVRAEPISSLYALGRVGHVGTFLELEDQLCGMTAAGYEGDGSPDRADALVWGMTELFPSLIRKKGPAKVVERPIIEHGWLGA